MTCADCGAAIEPGSELCFECGSPVRRTGDSSSSYSTSARAKGTPPSPGAVPASPTATAPAAPPARGPAPNSFDALIEEALRSVEEVSAPAAPSAAPSPVVAAPPTVAKPSTTASVAPAARPTPKRRAPIDDEEKVRCPGCGIPSTKERCPGCGTRLRPSED